MSAQNFNVATKFASSNVVFSTQNSAVLEENFLTKNNFPTG